MVGNGTEEPRETNMIEELMEPADYINKRCRRNCNSPWMIGSGSITEDINTTDVFHLVVFGKPLLLLLLQFKVHCLLCSMVQEIQWILSFIRIWVIQKAL